MSSRKGNLPKCPGEGPSTRRGTGRSRCSRFLNDFQMPLLDINQRIKFLDVVDHHLSSGSASDATRVIEQLVTDVGLERLVEVFSHRTAGSLVVGVSDRKLEEKLNMAVINLLARPGVAQSIIASKIYTAFARLAVNFLPGYLRTTYFLDWKTIPRCLYHQLHGRMGL
mmetsp:Transcript_6683/g.9716  ORF Transcript_6683/g.9716 Transcript_6683/m.9716 type:complete len:168 (-) Transcript_6683:3085-3588(-)